MSQTPLDTARAHWGADMPDWVQALADACTETSQNKVALRLGRSAALVSTVLRKSYGGSMQTVEQLVRGVLLAETVECPALGTMPMHECNAWRVKARALDLISDDEVALLARYVEYVDHAIQVGDSLLGITDIEQLRWLHLDPSQRKGKAGFAMLVLDARIAEATDLARRLRELSVITVRDAAEKQRLHEPAGGGSRR